MAEITIVVAGVLIALGLNAWWSAHQDGNKEQVYLRQIAADLAATERIMSEHDAVLLPAERATGALIRAFWALDHPPSDSLLVWAFSSAIVLTPSPIVGTVEALISTGDLELIRDPVLRSAITSYLDRTRDEIASNLLLEEQLTLSFRQLGLHLDFGQAAATALPGVVLDSIAGADPIDLFLRGDRVAPFPLDADTFLADREAYTSVFLLGVMQQQARELRARVRETSGALRKQIEAAIT